MVDVTQVYDPQLDIWPDLKKGRIVLRAARVGVNHKTGKPLLGWDHVEQSIAKIFSTRYHERVLRRYVGSFVPHLLGQSGTMSNITRFYWAIVTAIDLWEPNYRIQKVNVATRPDGSLLTSTDEFRLGNITTRPEGVYRPRAHRGDDTPEIRRSVGLIGVGRGVWERASG